MGKHKRIGTCCICGSHGPLSHEHVPPRKALNDRKCEVIALEKYANLKGLPWDMEGKKTRQHQSGYGEYTLCTQCNSNTGSWYAPSFIDFTYQGFLETYNRRPGGSRTNTVQLRNIVPVSILKQILAMFCSVAGPGLTKNNPHLRHLLLDRHRTGLNLREVRVGIYVIRGTVARIAGITSKFNIYTGARWFGCEIGAPPFGYVLALDKSDLKPYLDISFFLKNYAVGGKADVCLPIPVLESNSWLPTDHRTRTEIAACIRPEATI